MKIRGRYKIFAKLTALLLMTFSVSAAAKEIPPGKNTWLKETVNTIAFQLGRAAQTYTPGKNPRSVNPDGTVRVAPVTDWTTGFFPGTLWYGYELTGAPALAAEAKRFTLGLDSVRNIRNTHDLGFMLYSSYGNAFRITGDKTYLPALQDGAKNLLARFSPTTGTIRSWDFGDWHYPVIIDNMMNLEYLYWASGQFHDPAFAKAASSHATMTMLNHYRADFSSYHVVDYDPQTGKVFRKATHQGVTNESAWARGQAWGLYGFTMCYANTNNQKFLDQAENIASFIMNHPRMPKDKIPVWDFDVHNALDVENKAPRDASAAAVIASALIDLSTKVKDGKKYLNYAEDILKTLSSDEYLAKPGENRFFILKHSVGAFLYNSEIDTPLNYADYYYLEALKKFITVSKIDLKEITRS